MEQLLNLCASIIEATTTQFYVKPITQSIHVISDGVHGKVLIDSNDAMLKVSMYDNKSGVTYTETTVNLKQYTDRPPVEVIEELTNIALKEWSECNSEYLIDNKIKQLLKK